MTDKERVENNEENFEEHAEHTRRLRKFLETEPPWGKASPEKLAADGRELAEWLKNARKPKFTLGQKLWLEFLAFCFALNVFGLIVYAVFYPDLFYTIVWIANSAFMAFVFAGNYCHYKRGAKKEKRK